VFDGIGLIAVLLILFWVWALYDVITIDQNQVRNLPKILWIFVVLLLPPFALDLGAFLWLFLGRPKGYTRSTRQQSRQRPRRAPAPEPESPRDAAQRVVTDRRSAELDRMLEEWERSRRDQGADET